MDIFDSASALEAKQTDMALMNHFAKQSKPAQLKSAEECNECGSVIPVARQQFMPGCQYCTPCQTLIEQGKL